MHQSGAELHELLSAGLFLAASAQQLAAAVAEASLSGSEAFITKFGQDHTML